MGEGGKQPDSGDEQEELDEDEFLEQQVAWKPQISLLPSARVGTTGRRPGPGRSRPGQLAGVGPTQSGLGPLRIQAVHGKNGIPELRVAAPPEPSGEEPAGPSLPLPVPAPLAKKAAAAQRPREQGLFVPPRDPRAAARLQRKEAPATAGPQWFDLPATSITPELKQELRLLKLRGVMDPKKHYRNPDSTKFPKFFQVGTVVEGAADFFSSRLTRRERKESFAKELLHDHGLKAYRKRKYTEIQAEREQAGKKHLRRRQEKGKPVWARAVAKD